MAEKARCEACDKTFKDIDGLVQHNAVKHTTGEKKRNTHVKKIRNWIIFIALIGVIIGFVAWIVGGAISESRSCKTDPATEINIGGHTNLKLHIHADLRILIDGEEQFIPANIGVSPGVMRPIHTHDSSGELHIEGPCARDFTLGDFFSIFGREFSRQCIFDKCVDNGSLKFVVDGRENFGFENYVMRDGDNLLIEYKSR